MDFYLIFKNFTGHKNFIKQRTLRIDGHRVGVQDRPVGVVDEVHDQLAVFAAREEAWAVAVAWPGHIFNFLFNFTLFLTFLIFNF